MNSKGLVRQVAQLIPGGYASIAYKMQRTGGGKVALVTDAYQLEPNVGAAVSQVNDMTDLFINSFDNNVGNDWKFIGAVARYGVFPVGPTFEVSRSAFGLRQASSLPPNTAVLVQKRTQFGGRFNRGRFFVPGIAESDVDSSGFLAGVVLTPWQAGADAYLNGIEGLPGILRTVILHDEGVVGPDQPTPIVSLQVQSLVATQRRRMR